MSETHYSGALRNATSADRPSGAAASDGARWVVGRGLRELNRPPGAPYCLLLAERKRQKPRGDIDYWNDAVVRHARGPNHAKRADDFSVHLVWRCNHAHFLDWHEIRLAANKYLHAL